MLTEVFGLVKIQRYGIAYVDNKYVLAVELKKEGDETKFDGGAEYSLLDFLKLRAGFRSAEDFGGPTFGAQINLGTFSFDYAFLSYGDLGDIHKAGITISFGEGKVREKADKKTEPAKNEVNEPVVQTKSEILWTGEGNYVDGDVQPKQGND